MANVKAYIAGKITDDPNYRKKFNAVTEGLMRMGYAVMSPAIMPDGFEYEDYMIICFAMLSVCDIIFLLPDWTESPGASREYEQAKRTGMRIEYLTKKEIETWLELA
jgi:hypothetical protein